MQYSIYLEFYVTYVSGVVLVYVYANLPVSDYFHWFMIYPFSIIIPCHL